MKRLQIILLVILILGAGTWHLTKPENKEVHGVSWHVVDANPEITDEDDPIYYEDLVSVDVEFSDGNIERHKLGTAYGCNDTREGSGPELSILSCYFAATGVDFVALLEDGYLKVERRAEFARDGSIDIETVLEIQ